MQRLEKCGLVTNDIAIDAAEKLWKALKKNKEFAARSAIDKGVTETYRRSFKISCKVDL